MSSKTEQRFGARSAFRWRPEGRAVQAILILSASGQVLRRSVSAFDDRAAEWRRGKRQRLDVQTLTARLAAVECGTAAAPMHDHKRLLPLFLGELLH